MPLVPRPAASGPEPLIVFPSIIKWLPGLPILTVGPVAVVPPMTWIPAPFGKLAMALSLIDPVVSCAADAPRFATTLTALPNELAALVELVKWLPVIVRLEM